MANPEQKNKEELINKNQDDESVEAGKKAIEADKKINKQDQSEKEKDDDEKKDAEQWRNEG